MKMGEIHNYLKSLTMDSRFNKEQYIVNKLIKAYKLDGAILRGVSPGFKPMYSFAGTKENLEAMLRDYLGEEDIDPVFGPFKLDKSNKFYTEFTIEV